ncbi:hypothetical protein ACMD2_00721 [Ananas comosus]|uniref:Reverse transcriptase zinc-binding domain-containing protein n=1 Tax=Ananas comosus TaxID=4615 RepID=A0A199V3Y8_ANACO|nr:hypothetical protein ACMD2_00721 [Ananas comosus]
MHRSINKHKTELFYLGANPSKCDCLANILGCQAGNLPFRYLGLPLHNKTLRTEDWTVVINRIASRIEGWKAKLLSHGGRPDPTNQQLWKLKIPVKIKIFVWLLLRKRLLTADRLIDRGIQVEPKRLKLTRSCQ